MSANGAIKTDSSNGSTKDIPRSVNNGGLPTKEFIARNSVLTDLLTEKHLKNIYYMCCSSLMALFINTIAYDFLYNKELSIGHKTLFAGFRDFHIVLVCWSCISAINMLVYVGFRTWAHWSLKLFPKSRTRKIWNSAWLILTFSYYLSCFYFTAYVVLTIDLTITGSIILSCEQVRLLMKTHAFLRENVPKIFLYKKQSESLKIPPFQYYLFFLFVPTLVYRDEYPRTNFINYKVVAINLLEFFGALFLISFIFEKHFIPVCQNFETNKFNTKEILWSIMSNTLPAIGISTCSFYLLLHCWMNAFAELTRFADRQFYQDWWTATTYSTFYRKWNIVVHDWLFTYVYRDFHDYVTPKNKTIPKLMVFLISAIVHEYILALCMRMVFPVLFLEFFGLGLALYFVRNSGGSVFTILFIYGYALGMSITISSYTMEYCVRNNECSANMHDDRIRFLVPHILTKSCYI